MTTTAVALAIAAAAYLTWKVACFVLETNHQPKRSYAEEQFYARKGN